MIDWLSTGVSHLMAAAYGLHYAMQPKRSARVPSNEPKVDMGESKELMETNREEASRSSGTKMGLAKTPEADI